MQQALNFLEWLHARNRFDLAWGHYLTTAGFLATWFGRTTGLPSILSVRGRNDAASFSVTFSECCDGLTLLSLFFPCSDELSHGLCPAIGQKSAFGS